jgi:DNA-binding XRE family transcriptional regulator
LRIWLIPLSHRRNLPKHMHKANNDDGQICPSRSIADAAGVMNVGTVTVKQARKVIDSGVPELIAAVGGAGRMAHVYFVRSEGRSQRTAEGECTKERAERLSASGSPNNWGSIAGSACPRNYRDPRQGSRNQPLNCRDVTTTSQGSPHTRACGSTFELSRRRDNLWLDCLSERQIAEKLDVTQPTINAWVIEKRKDARIYQPPDSRQHFDVWNFGTDGDDGKAMAAARRSNLKHGGDRKSEEIKAPNGALKTQSQAADDAGVSRRTVQRAAKVIAECTVHSVHIDETRQRRGSAGREIKA